MYKRILVASDGSEDSDIVLGHAVALASKLNAEVSAFRAELTGGQTAPEILEHAREDDLDMIVVANRGGGSRRWEQLLGPSAGRLGEYGSCSVLIVRAQRNEARYRKMLVGFEGFSGSANALKVALELAKIVGSEIHVLWAHATRPGRFQAAKPSSADGQWPHDFFHTFIKYHIETGAMEHGLAVTADYRVGLTASGLASEAEVGGFDLIIVAQARDSELSGYFLEGSKNRVSDHARCDVLIVRHISQ